MGEERSGRIAEELLLFIYLITEEGTDAGTAHAESQQILQGGH